MTALGEVQSIAYVAPDAIEWQPPDEVSGHAALQDEIFKQPAHVIVGEGGGVSAGGHLALWTAITKAPYGSNADESPTAKPAALVLFSAPGDITPAAWGDSPKLVQRFGPHIGDVSPQQHLDTNMPPVIMFHGDADQTVPYHIAVALHDKLIATSNTCEFITVPGGSHGFQTQLPEWKGKAQKLVQAFLIQHGILSVSQQ